MEQGGSGRPISGGFMRSFVGLAGGFWSGGRRLEAWTLTAALVVLTLCQIVVPVAVNFWSQRFFDALEQRSMDRFMAMVGLIVLIIAGNMLVQSLHMWVKRRLQYGWREWLTAEVVNNWLWRGRHHQITYLAGDHDNPDGRITEDIRISTEYAVDLVHSLFYCLVLLVSFTQILWAISGAPEVTLGDLTFAVPGYLVYVAVAYAGAGTGIALLLGRPLVRSTNARQGREADLRFGLARVRENGSAITLLHAERTERGRIHQLVDVLKAAWNAQTMALANIMMFGAGWSVLSTAFPLMIAAPRYIGGAITLGVLMQTAQAFQQTVSGLSWPIDNLGRVAEWRASVERVFGLRRALDRLDGDISEGAKRIVVERVESEQTLKLLDLVVDEPHGQPEIDRFSAEIKPGERVLIVGDPGAAVKLFKAVARAWPWGSGMIRLPCHSRVFFMPQHPYFPSGTLRDAISYPAPRDQYNDEAIRAALQQVGMGHLAGRLDESDRWKETLALAEQQRLGFARLLLRRPDWILSESATDALDPVSEEEMMNLIDREFPKATLVTIGSHAGLERHHRRKFVLERTGESTTMREEATAAPPRPLVEA